MRSFRFPGWEPVFLRPVFPYEIDYPVRMDSGVDQDQVRSRVQADGALGHGNIPYPVRPHLETAGKGYGSRFLAE